MVESREMLSIDMLDIRDYNTRKNNWLHLMQYAKNESDSLRIMYDIKFLLKLHGQYNNAKVLGDSIEAVEGGVSFWNINEEIKKMRGLAKGFTDLLAKGYHKEALDIIEMMSNYNDSINPAYSNKKKIKNPLKEHSEATKESVKGWYLNCLEKFCFDENIQKEYAYILKDYVQHIDKQKENQGRQNFWFSNADKFSIKAKILAFENNYAEAIKLLEKYKTNSSDDSFLIQLACYYQEIKQYTKAEEIFSLVINKPKDAARCNRAKTNYYAALLYHDWGKQEKAEEYLNISLEIWKNADADYIFSNMAKATAQK